ncbi:hypothetical protein JS562_54835, partial [Agrobacterium sp. S2]|nr:hypothetical protein [Agrobacterium sp. S2]
HVRGSRTCVDWSRVVARDLARSLLELDASQGIVVGILGAWGRGKSSFVNLMREEFEVAQAIPVIEFNPWVFFGRQPANRGILPRDSRRASPKRRIKVRRNSRWS